MPTVLTLKKTCLACPSQWEGALDDGRSAYARFRHGHLSVGTGETVKEAVDNAMSDQALYQGDIGDGLDGFMDVDELARILLTIRAPRVNAQVLAKSTAYTKRNVQEAVTSLTATGVLFSFELGNEQVFSAPWDRWAQFLELDELPIQEDWPQLFAVFRKVLRWLADPAYEGLSDYMLSSETRTLAEEVASDLRFAGVRINLPPSDSSYFESFIRGLIGSLPV